MAVVMALGRLTDASPHAGLPLALSLFKGASGIAECEQRVAKARRVVERDRHSVLAHSSYKQNVLGKGNRDSLTRGELKQAIADVLHVMAWLRSLAGVTPVDRRTEATDAVQDVVTAFIKAERFDQLASRAKHGFSVAADDFDLST